MKIIQRDRDGAPELAVLHSGDDPRPLAGDRLASAFGTITGPTLYTRVTGLDGTPQHALLPLHGDAPARTAAALTHDLA